jgi:hypothetical protein
VDAGKLRASFAAAFSEHASERPSTASEFVASFEDAFSNRREMDEPAARVVVPFVSAEPEDRPSDPVLDKPEPVSDQKAAEDRTTLEPPSAQEGVIAKGRAARRRRARARRRERLATSEPITRESPEHDLRDRKSESDTIRLEPIVDEALLAEVTPPPANSIERASYRIPVQSRSWAFFVAASVVTVSFAAGFGGGFVVGHFSRPSTGAIEVGHHAPVAEPQPSRAAVEDGKPIASTTQTVAPMPEERVSSVESIAATEERPPAIPAAASGRLLVRSAPAGADVMVDGQSRGVTPLALGELALGAHTIEVSHTGHDTRRRRVTLSERRRTRSVHFELRPTSAITHATAATNSKGSLQVASRPSGAQVFVDDNLIGTTPLLLSNVAAGPRHLRLELSGYKIWATSVQIEPSARSRVSARLEP